MTRERIVPLIVAVALFMENMDSTVIATSLPAIAADIGTSPLTLKLAVTAYLLSLAVFIPVSGWTADRFGARTVFRSAIAVFMLGSIGCALSNSLAEFSGVLIRTNSTLSNWCMRIRPRVPIPAAPASLRKHGV